MEQFGENVKVIVESELPTQPMSAVPSQVQAEAEKGS
jgi:hypothetical protein